MNKVVTAEESDSARRSIKPRAPRRERGIQRYAVLLDSLDVLLTDQHPDDVGLYQIAEHAKVPPASVYHFFPTKEAAFLALAARYLERFDQGLRDAVEVDAFSGWLSFFARDSVASVNYFNSHPAGAKLLIGRYGGMQVRQADVAFNEALSHKYLRRLTAAFELPSIPLASDRIHLTMEIQDAIWAASYARFGTITEDYRDEAINACRAYLRLYYPENVALRPEIRAMIESGQSMILCPEWIQDAAPVE